MAAEDVAVVRGMSLWGRLILAPYRGVGARIRLRSRVDERKCWRRDYVLTGRESLDQAEQVSIIADVSSDQI